MGETQQYCRDKPSFWVGNDAIQVDDRYEQNHERMVSVREEGEMFQTVE